MNRPMVLSVCLLVGCFWATAEFAAADNAVLRTRQQKLNAALEKVSPALVSVQDGMGAGSGIVVSDDGIVLTASHVVDTRGRRRPRLQVVFPDGEVYRADLLGMNRTADAAMLKIRDSPRNGSVFPFVKLGESSKLNRGDWCFALGHPGGFKPDRPAPVRFGRVLSVGDRTVVSDCAIVLGDSGGPLFDLEGRVIGIHSMITEVIVENRHVAIDVFRRDGDRMEGRESWGRLEARDEDLVETQFFGVILRWRSFTPEVSHVVPDSPADRAGIRSRDVLASIANQQFADPLGLNNLLSQVAEHQRVPVQIRRIGQERTLQLTTGTKPSREQLEARRGEVIRIDADYAAELKQQLTSFRKVGRNEKRSPDQMDAFDSVVDGAKDSVVAFRKVLGTSLTYGAIMSSDGYILTKASELEGEVEPECRLSNGKRLRYRRVGIDRSFDLMLVKAEASNLTPVKWASSPPPKRGTIVVTTDSRGAPKLPGVVSVASRKLQASKRGFLGIVMNRDIPGPGVSVKEVLPGGAAERGKIQAGDVVLSINGQEVQGARDLVTAIQRIPPNSRVPVRYERKNLIKTVIVELTPQFVTREHEVLLPERYGRQNSGKFVSAHHTGFPEVIEHDTDLFPKDCGGPLFDINGNAIGLNIARAARITSYAIPSSAVLRVYQQLKAKDSIR